jgi:hypothetical protein
MTRVLALGGISRRELVRCSAGFFFFVLFSFPPRGMGYRGRHGFLASRIRVVDAVNDEGIGL